MPQNELPLLWMSDWKRFPGAIVDDRTSNASFIRYAQLLRSMGVRNCAWPLALIHPQLQGVDPHSPDLDPMQKVLIRIECDLNPWYVFREILRLPPNAGIRPIPYRANRGNMALNFCFYNHIDCALIQPRQTGKSGSVDCLAIDTMDIRAHSTMMYLITKDAQLRQANIERLKGIRSLLPDYLLTLTREDSDNQHELTNKYRGNRYRTGVGRSAESSANNLGRGMTCPVFQNDEGPFTPWIGVTLEAALAAGTAARLQAKEAGEPYGNIFTTTAGKKDSRDGRYMYNLIHSGAPWDERYLDAECQAEFEEMILRAGRSDKALANITMNHRQLGYDDRWLYDAMANALRNPDSSKDGVERDFLNVWTSGSLSSPLSAKLNEVIFNSVVDTSFTEITPERYTIRWYIPEDQIAEYMANSWCVLGTDTSDAIGRDATALILTDLRDLRTVAAITINETNLLRFSNFVADFLIRYPRVVWIPERKSSAPGIIDVVTTRLHAVGQDPFKRIFNRIVDEKNERGDLFTEIQRSVHARNSHFYDTYKQYFGFMTTAQTRQLLYGNVLQEAAKTAGHLVYDRVLSSEIRELVIKNDRIDHKESGNDDHVTAFLLSHWFARFARNLTYYGIDAGYVMSDVYRYDDDETPGDTAKKEQQRRQLAEIEAAVERLKAARDPLIQMKLEQHVKLLSSRVDQNLLGGEQTIEQMSENAAREQDIRRKVTPDRGRIRLNTNRFYSGY